MSMKTKAAILVTSFAVLLFVVVGSLGGVHASSNDGSYRQLQVYSEVLSRVRSEYVEEPNIPKVTDGALHGLLESLDSNSSYMTADAYKAYKAHKTEAKGGIGAVVSKRFGYAAVVDVLPGSPAEKAGIEQTDIFESIEGQSTRDMSLPEIPRDSQHAGGHAGVDGECGSGARAQGGAAESDHYPRCGEHSSRGR
jgi:carboxyl-terminal processing protease